MLASIVSARCCGTTKSGQRCSITSSSGMRDSLGRLVADPLRSGSPFCMLHTVMFLVEPAHMCDGIVVYIDLETNSLDVLSGRIVEIGALVEGHGFNCPRSSTQARSKVSINRPFMVFQPKSFCPDHAFLQLSGVTMLFTTCISQRT